LRQVGGGRIRDVVPEDGGVIAFYQLAPVAIGVLDIIV
jgi:hypothetical protein